MRWVSGCGAGDGRRILGTDFTSASPSHASQVAQTGTNGLATAFPFQNFYCFHLLNCAFSGFYPASHLSKFQPLCASSSRKRFSRYCRPYRCRTSIPLRRGYLSHFSISPQSFSQLNRSGHVLPGLWNLLSGLRTKFIILSHSPRAQERLPLTRDSRRLVVKHSVFTFESFFLTCRLGRLFHSLPVFVICFCLSLSVHHLTFPLKPHRFAPDRL